MKTFKVILYVAAIALYGCSSTVTETVTFTTNQPVFMSAKAFRESVQVTNRPEPVGNYGKMCFYEGYIYISESGKGIHIINNSNAADPKNEGFIELLGNADLAIRNGKLYADSYIDLVWFDISNPSVPTLEGRLEMVFPEALPPTDNTYGFPYSCYDENGGSKGIIVGWTLESHTETYTREKEHSWWGNKSEDLMMYADGSVSSNGGSNGVTGSMSRFALYNNYLYTVINNHMSIIDLSGDKPAKAVDNIPIGNDVETIFSYEDNMFMGTPTGMMIYSVANPLKPEYLRAVWHVFGCDPVVVENDIAYVTIHSGNACGQTNNDLIIYDVSDVRNPKHLVTYGMKNPKGLGIDNGTLFICDDGLKIFDADDPMTIMANRLAHYPGMDGFDVIPFNNVLMMIADDGLYQYDYSDPNKIHPLSKLPIVKK